MKQQKGVLMLFTGPLVPRPQGQWARYFNDGGSGALEPTYGSLSDVERWLTVDFEIGAEDHERFRNTVKENRSDFFCDALHNTSESPA